MADATIETPGESGTNVQVPVFLSSTELLEKLQKKWNTGKKQPYPAMYSSVFGGITLDPALMVIPRENYSKAQPMGYP
ncbi:hypothetical protein MKW94_022216 [Papaver nudicaule]|uniref:Uncharacterized protein n=1 Tax=Papaver nudicaule TaxID=74823 RepID=A0AA41V2Z6_PAPNU|nr:hypothetical protein [Papaver nudicaule]